MAAAEEEKLNTAAVEPKADEQGASDLPKTPEPPAEADGPTSGAEEAHAARKRAEERQQEARLAGKSELVQRLAALVNAWGRVISAQKVASDLERKATALQKQLLELDAQSSRAVTLVEQIEARRARALARLKELGLDERDAPLPPAEPKPAVSAPAPPGPASSTPATTGPSGTPPAASHTGDRTPTVGGQR